MVAERIPIPEFRTVEASIPSEDDLPPEESARKAAAQRQYLEAVSGTPTHISMLRPTIPGVDIEVEAVEEFQQHPPMRLGFLRDRRLRLRRGIAVEFRVEDGVFIAEAPELNEFGQGATEQEALGDLQVAIAELYRELEASADSLGSDLAATWQVISGLIETRAHQPT